MSLLAEVSALAAVPLWAWLVWAFIVGACIGSFLNVVIYRVPAGKSLVRPGSHCPKCGKPIRLWHNIPILGWVMLRGRCYDCKAPISARYPLVELAVGLIFVLLTVLIVPLQAPHMPEAFGAEVQKIAPPETAWRWQLSLLAYHLVLACFLVASGLIGVDGTRQKASLIGFAVFAGLVPPILAPWLRPTHFLPDNERLTVLIAIWDGVFGFAAGIIIGYLVAFARRARRSFRGDVMSVMAAVGAFLGWQAVVTVSAAASATELGRRWTSRGRTSRNPAPWITVAAFFAGVHLVAWRWIAVYSQGQSETTQGLITVVMLAVILGCSWGHQHVVPQDEEETPTEDSDSPASRRRAAAKSKLEKNRQK